MFRRPSDSLRVLRSALLGALGLVSATTAPVFAADGSGGTPQFENLPALSPASLGSLVFADTGTAEFGDLVQLQGESHFLGGVTVMLTNGAVYRDFPNLSPLGFTQPITLSLYAIEHAGPVPEPGALLARRTETFLIPWRRRDAPSQTFLASFDLAPLGLAVPGEIIYSISFPTRFGGQPKPSDRLGVALTPAAPRIGADFDPGAVYRRPRLAGAPMLRPDSTLGALHPAVRFDDSLFGRLFDTAARLETLSGPDARDAQGFARAAALISAALDRELWDGNAELSPAFGQEVFDLLAQAADELSLVAARGGPLTSESHTALDVLATATTTLAQSALADALIFGGEPGAVFEARSAANLAEESLTRSQFAPAIDANATAWEKAHDALR